MQYISKPSVIPGGENHDQVIAALGKRADARAAYTEALQEAFDAGLECARAMAPQPAEKPVQAATGIVTGKTLPTLAPFADVMEDGPQNPAEWMVKLAMPEGMGEDQFYSLLNAALEWATGYDG